MGDSRYSGIMMWPGGSYQYQGKYPTYFKDFEYGYDWYKRVDTVSIPISYFLFLSVLISSKLIMFKYWIVGSLLCET